MEAVFVPVKLDEGFDFSLFLEDLSFELPLNLMLLRMRQQHPVVVRALKSAIEPDAQPWEGWRTAGTLVVFRPLQATPWVEQELARREAERALADAETEERLAHTDPGIQGDFRDLDDAAAVVARLLSAVERIDELERVAGGLPAQLDEARREAEKRAAEAQRQSDALRADLQRALQGVPSELDRHEQLARLERLERAQTDGSALATAEAADVAPDRPPRPARARPRFRRSACRRPPGRGRRRRRVARRRGDRRVRPPLRGRASPAPTSPPSSSRCAPSTRRTRRPPSTSSPRRSSAWSATASASARPPGPSSPPLWSASSRSSAAPTPSASSSPA